MRIAEIAEQLRVKREARQNALDRLESLHEREGMLDETKMSLLKSIDEAMMGDEALEAEVKDFEAQRDELAAEVQNAVSQEQTLGAEIEELEHELDAANAGTIRKKERGYTKMEKRVFFGMNIEERDAFMEREEIKSFLTRVKEIAMEKRAVSGGALLSPTVVLDIIREQIAENSKLYKHVAVKQVSGKARQTVAGAIPEAVWTEMCATLNELEFSFSGVELDGYKVGGFVPVCNALLADNDINLAQEIISGLGKAIGFALDKAILYGTGVKMPQGIITRLAQTSKPDTYPATARTWADLHTSNLLAITGQTGTALFAAIASATAAAKGKYSTGKKFWAMATSTWMTLIANAMSINAAGAITTGMGMEMPVIGGAVELLDWIPNNMIIGGYGDLYVLAEREGTIVEQSEHARFIQDQTVFKASARYDGLPAIAEGFVGIGIGGTAPAPADVTFAADSANNDDAIADSITIGALTLSPSFSSAVNSYTASATNATSTAKVTVTSPLTAKGATIAIKCGDATVTNGGNASLSVGANTITVTVTYGTSVNVYTVVVTRAGS